MENESDSKTDRWYRLVANIGMGLIAFWLLSYLIPATRALMLDTILAFLIGLLVTGLLWWAAYTSAHPRCFWAWLAAAWTVALLGSIAWGVYELVTGESLPYISLVDALYLARYVLILGAFWRCLCVPAGEQWIRLLMAFVVGTAVVIGGFLVSVPISRQTAYWLAGAVYPILDVGLLFVAIEARRCEPEGRLRNTLGLVALALLAYGAANWLNFFGQAIPFQPAAGLSTLFWPLSDILVGLGVLRLFWTASSPQASTDSHDSVS
jgi:hypothetical protein